MATRAAAASGLLRHRPDWSAVVLIAGAGVLWWVLMLDPINTAGHTEHYRAQSLSFIALTDAALMWLLMVVAMMLPATIPAIRYVTYSTRLRRRQRSIFLFVSAFVVVWLAFGVPVLVVAACVPVSGWIGVVALSVAAAFELSPLKRNALRRCHRTRPIRFDGFMADRSCLMFGAYQGRWCIASCGPAMFAVVVLGHPLLVTALVGAILFAERVLVRPDRLRLFVGHVGTVLPSAAMILSTAP